jgi:hypothetical protein
MNRNFDTVELEAEGASPGARVHRQIPADREDGLGLAVIEALAEAKGVSPLEMDEPLYDSVDVEALGQLFDTDTDGPVDGRVVFTVDGYEVTVTASDDVYVSSPD